MDAESILDLVMKGEASAIVLIQEAFHKHFPEVSERPPDLRTRYQLPEIVAALKAHKKPVIRYWDVRWNRKMKDFRAEVNNLQESRTMRRGVQGFGYHPTIEGALMRAALHWLVRSEERKLEKAPRDLDEEVQRG